MTFAENVKRYRKERGWSQGQLAEKAGLSQQLISQVENGVNQSMSVEKLAALAKALDKLIVQLDPSLAPVLSSEEEEIGRRVLGLSPDRKERMLGNLSDLEAADAVDPEASRTPPEPQD